MANDRIFGNDEIKIPNLPIKRESNNCKSKDKIITSKLIVYCKSSEVYAVKRSINEGLYEDILESAMRQGPKICS